MKRIMLMSIVMLLSMIPASATTITTIPATGIDANTVTLNATYAAIPAGGVQVWFEYGMRDGAYLYSTPKETKTTNGAYIYTIEGYPLLAGNTFYYRGMATDATGNQSSFTLPVVVAIDDYNFDRNYPDLKTAKLNVSKTVTVLPKPYEDIVGAIFYGIFFGLIFMGLWIAQDDVTIPSELGILVSAGIFSLLPADYLKIGYALLVISVSGIIISIIFKK